MPRSSEKCGSNGLCSILTGGGSRADRRAGLQRAPRRGERSSQVLGQAVQTVVLVDVAWCARAVDGLVAVGGGGQRLDVVVDQVRLALAVVVVGGRGGAQTVLVGTLLVLGKVTTLGARHAGQGRSQRRV